MKTRRLLLPIAITFVQAAAAFAADGTSNTNFSSPQNWSTPGIWVSGTVADGAGFTATFDRSSWAGTKTITLDSDRTIGKVIGLGTSGNTAKNIIVGGTSILTLNNSGSAAQISNSGFGSLQFNNPLLLSSDLELKNDPGANDRFLTLGGGVSSSGGLKIITTKPSAVNPVDPNTHRIVIDTVGISDGAGTVAVVHESGNNLNLQNVANTFSGGLTINAGTVQSLSGLGTTALGATNGTITFGGSGNGTLNFSGNISNANVAKATVDRATTLSSNGTINVNLGTLSGNVTTITWSGNITGTGALSSNNTSGNILLLTGTNDYQGGTNISGNGTVATGATGMLGSGSINLAAGTILTLGNATSIGDTATLTFSLTSTINLSFVGTETLGSLTTGVTTIGAGTYNATQLNTFFGGSGFTGGGSINVVPEPGTWVLFGLGAAGLLLAKKRFPRRNS